MGEGGEERGRGRELAREVEEEDERGGVMVFDTVVATASCSTPCVLAPSLFHLFTIVYAYVWLPLAADTFLQAIVLHWWAIGACLP